MDMGKEAENFFKHLLSTEGSIFFESILNVIPNLVTASDKTMLNRIPSLEERKERVFQMSPDSTPGPDGYEGSFYQSCWEIIQEDLVPAVQFFFREGSVPKSINETWIAFIPKVFHPTSFHHFRPISLCYFLYKKRS